jgi:hypothetical protein
MTTQLFVLLLIGTVLAVYAGVALTAWIRLRGTRVVTCPETHEPVAVTLDAGHAAVTAVWDEADLRLASCTRWPERAGCDQGCLTQIAESGGETRPDAIAAHLFEGQRCAICGHGIDPIKTAAVPPGLLDPVTHEVQAWDEVAPERLRDAFKTRRAICANCTLAESFRRRYPDLVVDRGATRNT